MQMYDNDPTRDRPALRVLGPHTTAPALIRRWCPSGCGWSLVTDNRRIADHEQAAHRVQAHTTPEEQARIATAVTDWQGFFIALGEEMPTHLLPLIVDRALSPAPVGEVSAA